MNKKVKQKFNSNTTLTWIPDEEIKNYQPYSQVYGICFNSEGKILIINEGKDWKIPGGTPEGDEKPEETLVREVKEESSVLISDCYPLGVQLVDNKQQKDKYYQYRYIACVSEILPLSADPATGKKNKRKFIDPQQVTQYVKWGKIGEAMFKYAIAKQKKWMKLRG